MTSRQVTDHSSANLRWNDIFKEVCDSEKSGDDKSREWPHPDYFAAATRCKNDATSLEKLRRLSDDLESTISLIPGPGSLARVSGVPTHVLRALEGSCWREVLCDGSHSRLVWTAIQNYGDALTGRNMDSGSVRFGKLLSAVAEERLEKLNEHSTSAKRRSKADRLALAQKAYVPKFIAAILR